MAVFFAVLAAAGFASAIVTSKQGLQDISALAGLVISLPAGLATAMAFAAFDAPSEIPQRALVFLALAGLLSAAIGRLLVMGGVRRMNTGVYIPIQTSMHPLVGVLGGVLLFGEQIGVFRGFGAAAIVAGVWVVAQVGATPAAVSSRRGETALAGRRPSSLHLLFPVGAGIVFAGGDITTKEAMSILPNPAFGAAISTLVASVTWGILIAASPPIRRQLRFGSGKRWFVLTGVLSTLAIMCAYAALQRGDVSVVSPIIAAQPLVVLALSALFLRRLEVVDHRAFLGALLVVGGAISVGLS